MRRKAICFQVLKGSDGVMAVSSDNIKRRESDSAGVYGHREDSMDIISILRDILKRLWIIALLSASAMIFAFLAVKYTYAPVYSTTTTFVVTARGNSTTVFSNLNTASGLADVFSRLLNTQAMNRIIADATGESMSDGYVSAELIPETNLINMTVTANSPQTAFVAAKTIIENHNVVTDKILSNAVLDVLLAPTMPTSPTNPVSARSVGVAAFIITAAVLSVMIGAFSYWRDDIKNSSDAAKKLNSSLIATIAHEKKYKTPLARLKRKKTSILVTNPITSYQYVETFKMLRTRLEYRMAHRNAKVLCVASLKENEGKSTVAANISLILAQRSKRVLLVDADLIRPAQWKIFQVRAPQGASMPEVVLSKLPLSLSLECPYEANLHMLVTERANRSSSEILSSKAFSGFLERAREEYDYIIIDTPPISVASDAEIVSESADATVMVVQQSVARTAAILEGLELMNAGENRVLGIIFNNVYSSPFSSSRGYGYGYGYGGRYGDYRYAGSAQGGEE